MSDTSTITAPPAAKAEPLFVLDLGNNSGLLAPTTPDELIAWIPTKKADGVGAEKNLKSLMIPAAQRLHPTGHSKQRRSADGTCQAGTDLACTGLHE